MRAAPLAGLAGTLFGVGLAVSGMVRPDKVTGFLDVSGAWDPSLAFVMAGALAVHIPLLRLVRRRSAPWFDADFHLPGAKHVNIKLILGALLFGVGWGLGGFCPGPGLVSAAGGSLGAIVFVVGMSVGVLAEKALLRGAQARVTP